MERFFAANNQYTTALAANGFATTSGENPANAAYDVSAAACAGSTASVCVVISATPRIADATCGVLTISTAGIRGSSVPGAAATCWQR
jgi:Tfp pilus assembly protein PilE